MLVIFKMELRKMFLFVLWSLISTTFRIGSGQICKEGQFESVSMPLIDSMNAPLIANLDMSKLNKQLKVYIEKEIQEQVNTAMKELTSNIVNERLQEALLRVDATIANQMEIIQSEIINATNEIKGLHKTVGFHAQSTKHVTLSNSKTIVFDKVVSNIGNSYNPQKGHFIAPYDGLYVFESSIISGSGRFNLQMVYNNMELSRAHEHTSTMKAVVTLRKDDIVKVRHYPGYNSQNIYGVGSFFSGWLIS